MIHIKSPEEGAALFKALADRKSPFAFHPEVFDMWIV